jgi:hypothetical protein
MLKFVLLILVLQSSIFSQSKKVVLGEEEIRKSPYTKFENRNEKFASPERKAYEAEVGKGLHTEVSQTDKPVTYKGFTIQRFSPSEENKYGGDILTINKNAEYGHINSIKRILNSYIQNSFEYSEKNAEKLVMQVLYYNAQNRNKLENIKKRYTNQLVSSLDKNKVGIGKKFSDWPGNTQIVIPIKSGNSGDKLIVEIPNDSKKTTKDSKIAKDELNPKKDASKEIAKTTSDSNPKTPKDAPAKNTNQAKEISKDSTKTAKDSKTIEKENIKTTKEKLVEKVSPKNAKEESKEAKDSVSSNEDTSIKNTPPPNKDNKKDSKEAKTLEEAKNSKDSKTADEGKATKEANAKDSSKEAKTIDEAKNSKDSKTADEGKATKEANAKDSSKEAKTIEEAKNSKDSKTADEGKSSKEASTKDSSKEAKTAEKTSDKVKDIKIATKEVSKTSSNPSKIVVNTTNQKTETNAKTVSKTEPPAKLPSTKDEIKKMAQELKDLKAKEKDRVENSDNVVGEKIVFLKVKEFLAEGHYVSEMWAVDTENDDELFASPFKKVCGKEFKELQTGVVVMCFTENNNSRDTHHLALLNKEDLKLIKITKEVIFWRSFLKEHNGKIYAVEEKENKFYLSQFSADLVLEKRSDEPINPDCEIAFKKNKIYMTIKSKDGSDVNIKVLDRDTLKLRKQKTDK